jgi:hypothetical protein
MYKQVLQIRQILLRLGVYFPDFVISRNVPWHITLRRLRYAKVAQTMERTANIRHLVFCANCHKSVIHFSRLWLFAQWLCDLGIFAAGTAAES